MRRKTPTMYQVLKENNEVCLEREEERAVQRIARKHGLRSELIRYMVRNALITKDGMGENDKIILSFCRKASFDGILATYLMSGFDLETKYLISYLCTVVIVLKQNVKRE